MLTPSRALAETDAEPALRSDKQQRPDVYQLSARSETHAQLFERALLPGPGGAIVTNETVAPIYEFVTLAGHGIDSGLGTDSLDIEFSGWGLVQAAEPDALGRYDADIQTANVVLKLPSASGLSLRLGRQQVAGGAARFARFDGAQALVQHQSGLVVGAYGGLVVLPRWDRQPSYYHLGSAADSLIEEPIVEESVARGDYWLAGGKLGYRQAGLSAMASLHEQRDSGEIGRRNLGLDALGELNDNAALGGSLLLELDSRRLANLRVFGDLVALESLDLNAEYLRAEPALLLSRQSVLSVFATDAYHEMGGSLRWRPLHRFSFEGAGYYDLYQDSGPGARLQGGMRFSDRGSLPTLVSLKYVRVATPDNGYHSAQSALSQSFLPGLTGTLQHYAYFYDEAIEGYKSSSVYAATLEYWFLEELSLLWGGSISQSPYASLDASTQLRLTYQVRSASERNEW